MLAQLWKRRMHSLSRMVSPREKSVSLSCDEQCQSKKKARDEAQKPHPPDSCPGLVSLLLLEADSSGAQTKLLDVGPRKLTTRPAGRAGCLMG
ncbi:hypothetical protein TREES_T100002791 [Tupaia chinensis]|uniref:Uncharacterized protein n=1 Tax=Tupaia chinensis TaxID=246437 RepID=L9KX03_TUPCH|nr:hypothetical protein TREES_T100002791 [Tupaia chinensis]